MIPRAIGVGAGTKDFEKHPNVLRLILGDNVQRQVQHCSGDTFGTGGKTGNSAEGNTRDSDKNTGVGESLPPVDVSRNYANNKSVNKEHKSIEQKAQLWDMHSLTHMQANIDDATPELLAHAIELLLKNGAIDAWVHPIVMKKGRSAHSLHCICHCNAGKSTSEYEARTQKAPTDMDSAEDRLLSLLFRHTTPLG